LVETSRASPTTERVVIVKRAPFSSVTGWPFLSTPVLIFGPDRSTSTESGRLMRSAAARARVMVSACSSCVPCDMLMRTAFVPAAKSDSISPGSRDAGPSVASIFALLTPHPLPVGN
jgi:hypothetical protein